MERAGCCFHALREQDEENNPEKDAKGIPSMKCKEGKKQEWKEEPHTMGVPVRRLGMSSLVAIFILFICSEMIVVMTHTLFSLLILTRHDLLFCDIPLLVASRC